MTDAKTAAAAFAEHIVKAAAVYRPNGRSWITGPEEVRIAIERELASHDAALAAAVREQCAQWLEQQGGCNCVAVDIGVGTQHEPTCGLDRPEHLAAGIRTLPPPDADASQPSASRRDERLSCGHHERYRVEEKHPEQMTAIGGVTFLHCSLCGRIRLEARLDEAKDTRNARVGYHYGDDWHEKRIAELEAALEEQGA